MLVSCLPRLATAPVRPSERADPRRVEKRDLGEVDHDVTVGDGEQSFLELRRARHVDLALDHDERARAFQPGRHPQRLDHRTSSVTSAK